MELKLLHRNFKKLGEGCDVLGYYLHQLGRLYLEQHRLLIMLQ